MTPPPKRIVIETVTIVSGFRCYPEQTEEQAVAYRDAVLRAKKADDVHLAYQRERMLSAAALFAAAIGWGLLIARWLR